MSQRLEAIKDASHLLTTLLAQKPKLKPLVSVELLFTDGRNFSKIAEEDLKVLYPKRKHRRGNAQIQERTDREGEA